MAAQPLAQLADAGELVGEVERLVYANDANGFGVVELRGEGDADGARAAGPLASLVGGQAVRLVGRWTHHPQHGPTFNADWFEHARPVSKSGLIAYLASDRFPGVGKRTAERLVQAFGLDLGSVIASGPERLATAPGVSARQAQTVVDGWTRDGALSALVARLTAVGLGAGAAAQALRALGPDALRRIDADPYLLLRVRGVGWRHADALARQSGIAHDDPRRLVAGARAAVSERCDRGGHAYLDDGEALRATAELLGSDAAEQALAAAARGGALIRDEDELPDVAAPRWYRPGEHRAELGVAGAITRLATARSRLTAGAALDLETVDPALTAAQHEAVRLALTHPVSVLTGGPGTGKTRTVTAVVRAAAAIEANVALCAPTGRAAKRLEELTGARATTVHRLLEARPANGGGFAFGYDAGRRLPFDLVVADEWSMADARLAHALLDAVDDGASVLLVGDADQLPSVGTGAVLRDLLAAPAIPATALTEVHRQARESRIVTLAHEVDAGVPRLPAHPDGPWADGDVFAVPERRDSIAARVAEIVAVRAPAHFGCRPGDVQVLAPQYRGPAGVDALNAAIGARVNPPGGRRAVAGFYEGDRVVQTRNDAELGVANGEVGEVSATDPGERTLEVTFPQGAVHYEGEAAADLAPAWCLTVHKSQGGEWPVVVLVLDRSHRAMLYRELVYTGITRAVRGLLLVGEPSLLIGAARREGAGLAARRTALAPRLAGLPAG